MMRAMKTIAAGSLSLVAASICALAPAPAVGAPDAWSAPPAVPPALAVSAPGNGAAKPAGPATATAHPPKVLAHFHAVGAQVYSCAQTAGATGYAWTLQKPDATLFDQKGEAVGTHGAGPTWTLKDGSSVVAKKIAQADAPAADAIPWLLLRADKTSDRGLLSKVTYVHRVDTKKGKPPATKCDATQANKEARSDYSAEYYFYGS
jgi:Protein of unknown function (DUF3455)